MNITQQSNTRCRVYLHPACATSAAAIERIQKSTGLLVIVNLRPPTTEQRPKTIVLDDNGPWGGDAA